MMNPKFLNACQGKNQTHSDPETNDSETNDSETDDSEPEGYDPFDDIDEDDYDITIQEIRIHDNHGNSLLHYISERNRPDDLVYLINQGEDVNDQNNWGITPLMYACISDDYESASLLLKHGANVNLQNDEGNTAFHNVALEGKDLDLATLLLSYGAEPMIKNKKGLTVLDIARKNDDSELVDIIEGYLYDMPKIPETD